MWFEQLTGFKELNPDQVRANLEIVGDTFVSRLDGRSFAFGSLEVISLEDLRRRSSLGESNKGELLISEVVANVQKLHCDVDNQHALFQAASQFNLLEMVSPSVTPEQGIDKYQYDNTQGPACAIACGAGTIYRNYFIQIDDQIGQSSAKQLDCLNEVGKSLGQEELRLWSMQNGYALVSQQGLLTINKKLAQLSDRQLEELKGKLKVGIQWDSEVTIVEGGHRVGQIYCSALPVAYSHIEFIYWERFARLILEATYEATLHSAILNLEKFKSNKVFLTLVGGGAFGNEQDWILDALINTLYKFKSYKLDIKVVSYGRSNPELSARLNKYNEQNNNI